MTDDPTLNSDHLEGILRSITDEDRELVQPPAILWHGISDRVAAMSEGLVSTAPMTALPVTPLTHRSKRFWSTRIGAAAAVAAAIVGIVALSVGNRRTNENIIATAPLSSEGLSGTSEPLTGTAEVVETNGQRFLKISAAKAAPRSGEYLEVWLIDAKVQGMVSLGVMTGSGEFKLPPGLKIADYPIVDISSEPYDGQPAHSKASVLRGRLP